MTTDHEMRMEALRLFEENEKLRDILRAVDHTLTAHGHVDRETPLHLRIVNALSDKIGAIFTCLECEANYVVDAPCDECPVCGKVQKNCRHWPGQKRCGVCGMGATP